MKVALLQLNLTVGAIDQNAEKIVAAVKSLKGKADLCITSELALCGYPPKDMLYDPGFIQKINTQISAIASQLVDSPALLLGTVVANQNEAGKGLYNTAAFILDGTVKKYFFKSLIPNYDVFDEERYFQSSNDLNILDFKGKRFGITICEDIWRSDKYNRRSPYLSDPLDQLADKQIDIFINLSASPYYLHKQNKVREPLIARLAAHHKKPFVYVNQVGGNDDLVFDGCSCVFNENGEITHRSKPFVEEISIVDLSVKSTAMLLQHLAAEQEVFEALVCATRDYVHKCGFKKAVLGLSGGIDSAVTLAVAVEALGSENVIAILMPSPYSSQGSLDDAIHIAKALNVKTHTIPIQKPMDVYDDVLAEVFVGKDKDITEENIQARIRGNLLMAVANKLGALLLTTGNKSELSVGYCTIYGDMCGALAVISDVYKTLVYKIARWYNSSRGNEIIPYSTIEKAPSAELRPDQCDQDSLPDYEIIDGILSRYLEEQQTTAEIVAAGYAIEDVTRIINLFIKSEFKRNQAAPGIKVTKRAYGSGWRMPIAACYDYLLNIAEQPLDKIA